MKKNLKSIIIMFLCVMMFGTTVYGAQGEWQEPTINQKNSTIESIIEEAEDETSDAISYRAEDEFLDSSIETNALIGKTEEEIEDYFSNVYCGYSANNTDINGLITNPVTYLRNNVGKSTDSYTYSETKVSGVSRTTCDTLGGHNNCTLTALYNLMIYYRAQGYSKIPSTNSTLYSKIKKEATSLGYDYSTSTGLSVTKNNNLVKNTWRNGFGYTSGNGSNNYLWVNTTATKSINQGKPFIFSLASGRYYDHTVAVFGYRVYTNSRTNKSYTFLMLADGWSTSTRYLAWTNTGANYVACMTSISVPSSK